MCTTSIRVVFFYFDGLPSSIVLILRVPKLTVPLRRLYSSQEYSSWLMERSYLTYSAIINFRYMSLQHCSGSVNFWASRIRYTDVRIRIRSPHHQAKIVRKPLISIVMDLCWRLEGHRWKEQDPDPLVIVTDPEHWFTGRGPFHCCPISCIHS